MVAHLAKMDVYAVGLLLVALVAIVILFLRRSSAASTLDPTAAGKKSRPAATATTATQYLSRFQKSTMMLIRPLSEPVCGGEAWCATEFKLTWLWTKRATTTTTRTSLVSCSYVFI